MRARSYMRNIKAMKNLFLVWVLASASLVLLILGLEEPVIVNAATIQVAYWQLDENNGSLYLDSTGNNHDGNCIFCPTAVPAGQVNGGQLFDGSTTLISIDAHPSFDWDENDSFSIELWLKAVPGQTCSGGDQATISRQGTGTGFWSLGCTGGSGAAYFKLEDSHGTAVTMESTKVIADGAWHHIVGMRDGLNNINYLYVDGGIEIISTTQTYLGNFVATTEDIRVGMDNISYFEGFIDEVSIHQGLLPLSDIRNHYFLSRNYANSCNTAIKIMPLGDSITEGANSGVTEPNKYISYRWDLWHDLNGAGYSVDFVGSLTNGEYYQPLDGFDPEHEGHGGWRDDQVANNIFNWLSNNPADVVLLHIGTNGLNADSSDVEQILDEIDRFDERITVILARIINRSSGSTVTTLFNDYVEAMAMGRVANGDKIIIVDMEDGAGINYALQPAGDMWDNLHPFHTGYNKMADVWFSTLAGFTPVCAEMDFIYLPVVTQGDDQPLVSSETIFNKVISSNNDDRMKMSTANSTSGVPGHPYSPNVIESGQATCELDAISYWKLDESSGTLFADSVGVNDANCTGDCPDVTSGQVANARFFDGSDEVDALDINNQFDFSGTDDFSVELWVNIPDTEVCADASSTAKVFVGRRESELSWWVGCRNTTSRAAFSVRDTDSNLVIVDGNTSINDGEWHHIVAVRNGATNQNLLYVDNVLENSKPAVYTGNFSGTQELNFGYFDISPYYHLTGTLDEVALYGRVLSPVEIDSHYNNGLSGGGYCGVESLVVNVVGNGSVTKDPDLPIYAFGQVVTLTATPNSGWHFLGWNGDLLGNSNPETITMNGPKIITATFVDEIYYVNLPIIIRN